MYMLPATLNDPGTSISALRRDASIRYDRTNTALLSVDSFWAASNEGSRISGAIKILHGTK